MTADSTLQGLLAHSAERYPDSMAVDDPGRGTLSYRELDDYSTQLSQELVALGVAAGDRVGMYLKKSLGSVVTLFAALKSAAAYVPVDASAPVARNCFIFGDCGVRALVMESDKLEAFLEAWEGPKPLSMQDIEALSGYGLALKLLVFPASPEPASVPDNLAYILYTSGSTGKPKGVMHTHGSALGFVDWCLEEFDTSQEDRFSSHAPFHFDLSIFDIYVSMARGAALVLVSEAAGKQPLALAQLISERRISVWYSTPSTLRLLVEFGKLEECDFSALKLVLFAGETYTLAQCQQLKAWWPDAVFYNLYGPTETNVCTYYQVPASIAPQGHDYFPIGYACSGDELRIVDDNDEVVSAGDNGELLVRGRSVMSGYWNLPQRNEQAFTRLDGHDWYRTGDIVGQLPSGAIHYLSRRDRMVKRRGYRVELGEIESALYRFEGCVEAAAIALSDDNGEVIVKAFLVVGGDKPPSIIALKTYCAKNLISYMIPDQFAVLPALPKTSTDKVDYQKLKEV